MNFPSSSYVQTSEDVIGLGASSLSHHRPVPCFLLVNQRSYKSNNVLVLVGLFLVLCQWSDGHPMAHGLLP